MYTLSITQTCINSTRSLDAQIWYYVYSYSTITAHINYRTTLPADKYQESFKNPTESAKTSSDI